MEVLKIVERVRVLMESRNVSVSMLADKSGIARPSISRFLSGKIKNPTLSTLTSIADALGVPVRSLFPCDSADVNGYIEHDGGIERIRDFRDLERIVSKLKK